MTTGSFVCNTHPTDSGEQVDKSIICFFAWNIFFIFYKKSSDSNGQTILYGMSAECRILTQFFIYHIINSDVYLFSHIKTSGGNIVVSILFYYSTYGRFFQVRWEKYCTKIRFTYSHSMEAGGLVEIS